MKVKIIRGWYGHKSGCKSASSEAFEVSDKEAERIISLGIAEAVSVSEDAPDGEVTGQEEEKAVIGHLDEAQLRTMSFNDLRKLAKEMGVDTTGKADEIIARLIGVEVEVSQNEEDTDEGDLLPPPELNAEEPM